MTWLKGLNYPLNIYFSAFVTVKVNRLGVAANNVSNREHFARTLDNTIKHAGIIASNKWSSTRNYDGQDYSCAVKESKNNGA